MNLVQLYLIFSIYAIVNSKFIEQDNLNITSEKSNELGHYMSDAIMSLKRTYYWPKATIPFVIDNNLGNYRNLIKSAMKHISHKTCIHFKKRDKQKDYIYFTRGSLARCNSRLGMVRGRQDIVLGKNCHYLGVYIHEIMHSLGIYHEHQRYDRDQYLTVKWNNILEDEYARNQFTLLNKHQMKIFTKFDFKSIMSYGPKAFSKNNHDTLVPKVKSIKLIALSNKTGLSHSDIITLKSIYCQKRLF